MAVIAEMPGSAPPAVVGDSGALTIHIVGGEVVDPRRCVLARSLMDRGHKAIFLHSTLPPNIKAAVYVSGPQGCGKTNVATHLIAEMPHYRVVEVPNDQQLVVVDGGLMCSDRGRPVRAKRQKVADFKAANEKSPVIAGRALEGSTGGAWYRLHDGTVFRLNRAECHLVGMPRWYIG